ncbi:MAG: DUF2784 domain-containing protein [Acidobacteriota bacterium]
MLARWIADLILVVHAAFVLFVVFGALLVARWPRLAWLHLPAVAWGFTVEATGWFCPLTDFENAWRRQAGEQGYEGGFLEHYLLSMLYPEGLTRTHQWLMALFVVVVNGVLYARLVRRWRRERQEEAVV